MNWNRIIMGATAVLLLGSFSVGSLAASDGGYVYEQQDAEAQQAQYLVKIEGDLQKCDLAIENTKVLIGRSKNRPYQPTLLMRLAELYIEKSRLVYYLRRSAQEKDPSGLDQFEANMLKQEAIEIYQQILTYHPDYEECDKVHFFLAHEYQELGDFDKMLVEYREIIGSYPDSDYVPESHLLMGDYFFNQKQDLDTSISQYEAVLRYPESPSAAIARYKLAWCRINEEDHEGAMALFEEAVKGATASADVDIDTYQRVDVRLESMIDMAYCYPEVHEKSTPEEAIDYFRQYAWSRPVYAQVLEKLASRYYVKKKWRHSAGVYRVLSDLRQDPDKLLEYTHRIFECVQALGNYDTAEQDVALLVKALEKQRYSVHMDDEEKEKNLTNFELFARETITHLHDKARNTGSNEDFAVAADAYGRYLDFFDDSPAAEDMRANYAEALFSAERYLAAGKQYEKLAPAITVNRKQRMESLYSSVISYYNALKGKDDLNFYESAYARAGLRTSGTLFTAENPDSSRTPDVAFNVAWVTYDTGDYAAAISEFSRFIDTYPTHSAATAAVHLTLDAYYLLEDEEGLVRYGKSVLADSRLGDAELRAEIGQIVRGTESKMVSNMTMTAMNDWESGKAKLAEISESDSETSEQALNALILTAREKKDLPTLYDAGMRLAARYPDSENLENTLGILIDTSMKIGQFRLLGDFMEDFGQRYSKDENATDFVLQAARIQEALGNYAAANNNYRRRITMGPLAEDVLDDVVCSMAENAESLDNPSGALEIYGKYLSRLSEGARIRAYARMATLYRASGQRTQSKKYGSMARKAFEKKSRYGDALLQEAMGQMEYEEVYGDSASYFDLQFKGDIDNKIFAQKSELLTQLEDGYQEVMGYKSAAWSLRACFRAAELNREFATFLKESPLPSGLSDTEQAQYRALLVEKADTYSKKADEYLRTSIELAEKSEACDPRLAGYFLPKGAPRGSESAHQPLSPSGSCRRIERQGLTDVALGPLYERLLASPDDANLQLSLAQAYLDQGDYLQAGLIAQNALSKLEDSRGVVRAKLLNLIGVVRLNEGRDPLARDAFKQALSADSSLAEAKINLAGLYSHYGHSEKAAALLKGVTAGFASVSGGGGIYPQAGAYVNEIATVTP